ncbi:low molecular weight phosphatase family protein [Pontibacter cellulosilyticus]|uniref:Protein-tyrosine-phosphatase n=1 Tax=Pontibacter cellulosilyticus TaxID=1720253 RepID=A0A923N7X7_9BACT|nr:protein-tyrosine-phosphatase [Pontibacter cellulosilyticus]MBC5994560.1 protein-tyrosine-phosphatase [Pontibacter cellulosilyticus]
MSLLPALAKTTEQLTQSFDLVPAERKELLQQLSSYIRKKTEADQPVALVFICTHNSRRSHISQLWAQAAAAHFSIDKVTTYSGGTEATAFYPAAVKAMQQVGFEIQKNEEKQNPEYKVTYAADKTPVEVWSKKFDDSANPASGFCAIMTCSDADGNCPFVPGAEQRIAITYEDPKASDGTAAQDEVYLERALQIGREMLFAFSKV